MALYFKMGEGKEPMKLTQNHLLGTTLVIIPRVSLLSQPVMDYQVRLGTCLYLSASVFLPANENN